ncbi:VOC family protein [Okibacterium fritillariae]|uniref:VOC family protein n=1 Tax=Okibacterium fritillariae TaxID=123320 RepID=UPI004055905C
MTADAWPPAISAITLFVDDLVDSIEFYRTAFGLDVMFLDDDSAVFSFNNTLINLLKVEAAEELVHPAGVGTSSDNPRMQFTIPVDDVDERCAELVSRGVVLLNGPMDRPWGIRTASFRDPSGYVWEIAR